MTDLMNIIRGRKSVRTFDGNPITEEDKEKLQAFIQDMDDPFGQTATFRFLDPKEHGLKSPVLSGETMYLAAKMPWQENAEVAYGYLFEQVVLYAWSLGIGTTIIAGTMNRDAFEKAVDLQPDEKMPCITPVGYPAKKRALRESMMRKGVKADWRKPAEELFFDGNFNKPLSGEEKEKIADLIEAVQWAPSAVNKQPWRIVLKDGAYHFYEKKDRGYDSDSAGDLQKIDIGIALCHFVLMAKEKGFEPEIFTEDPQFALPDNTKYIISVRL